MYREDREPEQEVRRLPVYRVDERLLDALGFRIEGLGLSVWGLGFGVWGLWCGVGGFKVEGLGF